MVKDEGELTLDDSSRGVPPWSADSESIPGCQCPPLKVNAKPYAVALDCNSVAAHVQALTIPAAINPGGTLHISPISPKAKSAYLRLAELNSSDEVVLYCV